MESPPRTTIALGPLEITFTRREEGGRLGVFGSIVVHAIVIALLMFVGSRPKTVVQAENPPPSKSPIPITFVNPLPPQPKPQQEAFAMRRPPPSAQAKPLRMQSVPETTGALKTETKEQASKDAGRRDKNPAGGEQGGPKPVPTPGVPPPAPNGSDRQTTNNDVATNADEPKDILGRLRDFKRAVEAPHPSTPNGPQGGGK
jgi:hypothetical protein